MSFGGDADAAESGRMYAACRDRGINFFDCANAYTKGAAETILGKLIDGHRDELIVTSKCFQPDGTGLSNSSGGNRRNIQLAVEASLKRLGTDRLDILFMHRWDKVVPLEETLRALEKLVADGKVIHLGASNYAAWQIAKGLGISEKHGWPRFDVIQPMYSLVKRQVEVEILPLARAEKLGVISYFAGRRRAALRQIRQGRDGRRGPAPGSTREYTKRYGESWVFEVAQAFTAKAGALGVHPVSLAVAWVGGPPGHHLPDHRRPLAGAAPAVSRLHRRGDERDPQVRDRGTLPYPAAGHRPAGGTGGIAVPPDRIPSRASRSALFNFPWVFATCGLAGRACFSPFVSYATDSGGNRQGIKRIRLVAKPAEEIGATCPARRRMRRYGIPSRRSGSAC